jgi:predicted nucleic acid-binding protein
MILVDTSAWAEFYRRTGSPVHGTVASLLRGQRVPTNVATTEPVVMELLAGRQPSPELAEVRRRLLSLRMLHVEGLDTWELGAAVARACRARGETIGSQMDCLIAAVAIQQGASVLHADRDFDVIARHTPLRIEPVHK